MPAVSLSISESKSKVDLSLESKDASLTWDEADFSWDDAEGTWGRPGRALAKESKSNISLSLEPK